MSRDAGRPVPDLRQRHALPGHRAGRRTPPEPAGRRGGLPARPDLLRTGALQHRLPAPGGAAGSWSTCWGSPMGGVLPADRHLPPHLPRAVARVSPRAGPRPVRGTGPGCRAPRAPRTGRGRRAPWPGRPGSWRGRPTARTPRPAARCRWPRRRRRGCPCRARCARWSSRAPASAAETPAKQATSRTRTVAVAVPLSFPYRAVLPTRHIRGDPGRVRARNLPSNAFCVRSTATSWPGTPPPSAPTAPASPRRRPAWTGASPRSPTPTARRRRPGPRGRGGWMGHGQFTRSQEMGGGCMMLATPVTDGASCRLTTGDLRWRPPGRTRTAL